MKTAKSGSIAPNFPKGVLSENLVLSNRCISKNQDSEGRFDSTKFSEGCRFRNEPLHFKKSGQRRAVRQHQIFRRVSFQKTWCYRTAAFQKIRTAKGGSIAPNCPKGVFRKPGAVEPLRSQKIRTAKGGSIAPNFPKGVVSENLVLSNRCVSENQDGKGRFDDKKVIEM